MLTSHGSEQHSGWLKIVVDIIIITESLGGKKHMLCLFSEKSPIIRTVVRFTQLKLLWVRERRNTKRKGRGDK